MARDVVFAWEGTDHTGRTAKGEIASASARLARAELLRQGVRPTRVQRRDSLLKFGAKVTPADIALFARQLATMVKAGVPLVQALEIVAQGASKPAVNELILGIRDEVSAGNSLGAAVRSRRNPVFEPLFCSLIDAGEQSGTLDVMLDQLAIYGERSQALKSKVKSAMNYPVAVVLVAGLVTGILLVKVVPEFERMFSSFGAELPEFTRMVVSLSRFVQDWWLTFAIIACAALVVPRLLRGRYPGITRARQRLALRLPIFGNILQKSCVARITRSLAITLGAGVPLVDALNSVAGAAGNVVFEDAILRVRDEVATGIPLAEAMRRTDAFPNMMVQMTAVGEESGTLDAMLIKVAEHFEAAVEDAVAGLTSLMEPAIMCLLAVIIGGLVLAMYLPVFTIGEAMGGGY